MRRSVHGLTIIEILVALVLLAIVSTAIVGSFALLRTVNQDAATDVDYSRAVRSAMERIRLEWDDPDLFEAERIGTLDGLTVDAYVSEQLNGNCGATVVPDDTVPDDVKLVRITCDAVGGLPAQVFESEFGRP